MSGYQEVATDPSFEGQIVCFTAPMVGNYGVDETRSESRRAHAKAVVMRDARGPEWTDWLHERGIVALTGVDTRSLVLHLRDRGAMRAAAVTGDTSVDEALAAVRAQPEMAGVGARRRRVDARALHVRRRGTPCASPSSTTAASARSSAGWPPTAPPSTSSRTTSTPTRSLAYDGVLLSPGPGDPEPLVGRDEDARGAPRTHTGARRLPRPSAARARHRQADVQAAVRPSRCEPSGARPPHPARPRHRRRTTASRSQPATSPA